MDLVKMKILIQWVWGGTWDSVFIKSPQVGCRPMEQSFGNKELDIIRELLFIILYMIKALWLYKKTSELFTDAQGIIHGWEDMMPGIHFSDKKRQMKWLQQNLNWWIQVTGTWVVTVLFYFYSSVKVSY